MAKNTNSAGKDVPGGARKRKEAASIAPAQTAGRSRGEAVELGKALVEAFLTNERINQVLLDLLKPEVWRAQPPCAKRRNIATTFAHMHNVRCMRLKMCARDEEPPPKLERGEVTVPEAKEALGQSARAMVHLIEQALASGGHVPDFRPDVVALVCSAITHDAHHRGQICHWASQLGAPLPPDQQLQMWEWDKRWKDIVRD